MPVALVAAPDGPLWLTAAGARQNGAAALRRMLQAIHEYPGIKSTGDLQVAPTGPASMSVQVSAGGVLIAGTQNAQQGFYEVDAPAAVTVGPLPAAPAVAGQSRIDLIVAYVLDSDYTGGVADGVYADYVQGVAGVAPVAPAAPANSIVLAQVAVAFGQTTIVAANITDKRVLSGLRSFVASAYQAAAQAGVSSGWTITLDSIDQTPALGGSRAGLGDPSGMWSLSNHGFVVPITRSFFVEGRIEGGQSIDAKACIFVNGVAVLNGDESQGATTHDRGLLVLGTLNLNVNDIVTLGCGFTSAAFTTGTGKASTYLKIRALK